MEAAGVRRRTPIKCKNRVLEYLKERRNREIWSVYAVGVRCRRPIKSKERVLEYLWEKRNGAWMLWP